MLKKLWETFRALFAAEPQSHSRPQMEPLLSGHGKCYAEIAAVGARCLALKEELDLRSKMHDAMVKMYDEEVEAARAACRDVLLEAGVEPAAHESLSQFVRRALEAAKNGRRREPGPLEQGELCRGETSRPSVAIDDSCFPYRGSRDVES
jgi:hypothetical protein